MIQVIGLILILSSLYLSGCSSYQKAKRTMICPDFGRQCNKIKLNINHDDLKTR